MKDKNWEDVKESIRKDIETKEQSLEYSRQVNLAAQKLWKHTVFVLIPSYCLAGSQTEKDAKENNRYASQGERRT